MVSEAESRRIRQRKPDLIVPSRLVRTSKHKGLQGQDFLAKSKLVVQGLKDKALGHFLRTPRQLQRWLKACAWRWAPTTQFCPLCQGHQECLLFSGKNVAREICLEQPEGGLQAGQLLKALKAIQGFSEAARMFRLTLKEHLES